MFTSASFLAVAPARVPGALVLAASLLGCASPGHPPEAPAPSAPAATPAPPEVTPAAAPAALPGGRLPTPISADQIRDAMPAGTQIRFEIGAPGAPRVERVIRVDAADAAGMTAVSIVTPEGGAAEESPPPTSARAELRAHASFVAADTQVSCGTITFAGSEAAVRRHVVKEKDDKGDLVATYDVDLLRPGPPIQLVHTRAGQEEMRVTQLGATP